MPKVGEKHFTYTKKGKKAAKKAKSSMKKKNRSTSDGSMNA